MAVRCDAAPVAISFPRHGRVGAPGHAAKGSALWHGGGSCAERPWASLPSSPGLCFGHWCQALEDMAGCDPAWGCASSVHVPKYPIPLQIICADLLINCKCFPIQNAPM